MHFWAPAKCISAGAQRYTLLPKQMRVPGLAKCTLPPCQRELSVQTMLPTRTDVGNAVVGPPLHGQCRLP